MDDNKIVKTIEAKQGGKSGTYWTVTWQDDKKDNIFDKAWLPLLEQSQKNNRLLHFTKEKKGNYYNIVSLELATLPDEPQQPLQSKSSVVQETSNKPIVEHKSSPETGMWWGQMGEMLRCGDIDKTKPEGKALRSAYYAEMLRVLGINVKEAKNALVEEAKKLGAKEM